MHQGTAPGALVIVTEQRSHNGISWVKLERFVRQLVREAGRVAPWFTNNNDTTVEIDRFNCAA